MCTLWQIYFFNIFISVYYNLLDKNVCDPQDGFWNKKKEAEINNEKQMALKLNKPPQAKPFLYSQHQGAERIAWSYEMYPVGISVRDTLISLGERQ